MAKIPLTTGDSRRAAAIIAHFGRGDQDGLAVILEESIGAARHGQLLLAVLSLYNEMVPELRTDVGMQLLSSHVLKLATMEDDETEQGDEP